LIGTSNQLLEGGGGEVHFELHFFYNKSPNPNHNVKNTHSNCWVFSSKESYLKKSFCFLPRVEKFSISEQ